MEGEIEQPTSAPEPEVQQTEQQPDLSLAPTNAIDSLSGMTEQPGQTKENPDTLLPVAELRPRMAELEGKISLSRANYTEGEDFYNENGWRAYLEKYGDQGYTLQEIAQHEKLDSEDIKKGIEDGIIKDPQAIQLYGQTKLDSDKQYYTKWALEHTDDAWVQQEAKRLIAMTEQECLPLASGNTKDLLEYSNQQAKYRAEEARHIEDSEQRSKVDEIASRWTAMSKQLEEQETKEKSTDQASEAPEQLVSPEEQQAQELQNQLEQLKTKHEKVLAENTVLRDAFTQATTELQEIREAIEDDEAIDPKKKEHWLLRLAKIISALAAKTLLDAMDAVETNLEK